MIKEVLPNLDNSDNLKLFNVRTIEEAPHRQTGVGCFLCLPWPALQLNAHYEAADAAGEELECRLYF